MNLDKHRLEELFNGSAQDLFTLYYSDIKIIKPTISKMAFVKTVNVKGRRRQFVSWYESTESSVYKHYMLSITDYLGYLVCIGNRYYSIDTLCETLYLCYAIDTLEGEGTAASYMQFLEYPEITLIKLYLHFLKHSSLLQTEETNLEFLGINDISLELIEGVVEYFGENSPIVLDTLHTTYHHVLQYGEGLTDVQDIQLHMIPYLNYFYSVDGPSEHWDGKPQDLLRVLYSSLFKDVVYVGTLSTNLVKIMCILDDFEHLSDFLCTVTKTMALDEFLSLSPKEIYRVVHTFYLRYVYTDQANINCMDALNVDFYTKIINNLNLQAVSHYYDLAAFKSNVEGKVTIFL